MSEVDYLNALGVGASFNTKEIVKALVEAEKAPTETRLNNAVSESTAQISALATAKSSFSDLQAAAATLNDVTDFDNFTTSNSQPTALSISAGAGAVAGAHTITVDNVARAQTTNLTQTGSSVFTDQHQTLNSGSAFDLSIQVGGNSGVTHAISVTVATPLGIVDAINNSASGVSATLRDTGTAGSSYVIQLTGLSGASNSFTVSEPSTSLFATDTPNGFSATDASLTVNGLAFSRASNDIDDIITGVTLNLNSATTGASNVSVQSDTSVVEGNIRGFVDAFNTTKQKIDELTDRETEAALRSDSVVKRLLRDVRNIMTNISSSPGDQITRISDIGISINKVGTFEIDDAKLSAGMTGHLAEVAKIFSANTSGQTEIGVAVRGVAGDMSKLINDFNGASGYASTKTTALNNSISEKNEDLADLEVRIAKLQTRYERQFAAMQQVIDEMNNTRDNLITSFENLPFTAEK